MKIFPYILSRVGGLEFEQTEMLAFKNMDIVNVLLKKGKVIEIEKNKIIASFQEAFQRSKDYRFRAILLNTQKDFSNSRFSFLKKLNKNAHSENDKLLVEKLLIEIKNHKNLKDEFEEAKMAFQNQFKIDQLRQTKFLQKVTSAKKFKKGILQSSQSLFQRLFKFQSKSAEDFRKKEMQTARSVAQYFYRISAKTSPFSYFTTLNILGEKNGIFESEKNDSKNCLLQFNNFLLVEIQNQLLKIPSFYEHLNLELNSTIRLENKEFVFLKNERNVEIIQRIEAEEALILLHNNIITSPKSFREIIDELAKIIEADRKNLEDYLLQIIDTGFLEWKWEISPLTIFWENSFFNWLKNRVKFERQERWVKFIKDLINWKKEYQNGDSEIRFSIQKKLNEELEKMEILNFPNELIFFEDVQNGIDYSIEKIKIQPIIKTLNLLLNKLEPLIESELKEKIRDLWLRNFKKEDEIAVLDFYERFYQTEFSKSKINHKDLFNRFKETKNIEEGILNFSISDFDFLSNSNQSKSYAGLFQFYQKGEKYFGVINGIAPGYGKLFGRFLPMFDEKILNEVRMRNEDYDQKSLCIENIDASIFNANQHPSFFKHEIKTPNGQNQLSEPHQIKLKELSIIWSEKEEEPILVLSKNKKKISIFDFGFEHPSNRSPMYQLLNAFQKEHATFRIFTKRINQLFFQKKDRGILCFPRIVLDNHLILQRKSIEVPNSFFPKKEKSVTAAEYFYQIQKWKDEEKVDRHVFIKPIKNSSKEETSIKKDFFKPQYFDLESPFAIILLHRVLEKFSGRFKIEEMLPKPSDVLSQKNVREEIVQFENI